MGRLKDLRKEVDKKIFKAIEEPEDQAKAIAHLYGVSCAAQFIAQKRGLDPELAGMAGQLHDIYAYTAGTYDDHAHKGAEQARGILEKLAITSDEETDIICSAIYHHDDKAVIDAPMDEVLKDADVIHHTYNDLSKGVKEKEKARYEALHKEFGF